MSSSDTTPINTAVIPVVSASVSSVRLPMPIMISASGYRRRTVWYLSNDSVKPKWIGSRMGSSRKRRPCAASASAARYREGRSEGRSGISTGVPTASAARCRVLSLRLSR